MSLEVKAKRGRARSGRMLMLNVFSLKMEKLI